MSNDKFIHGTKCTFTDFDGKTASGRAVKKTFGEKGTAFYHISKDNGGMVCLPSTAVTLEPAEVAKEP